MCEATALYLVSLFVVMSRSVNAVMSLVLTLELARSEAVEDFSRLQDLERHSAIPTDLESSARYGLWGISLIFQSRRTDVAGVLPLK